MKRFLLPLLAALALPSYASELTPEIKKMCLKASDYKGCIEAQLERHRKPISSIKPVRSKVEDYDHYPKYRTDQVEVLFYLATAKCSVESDNLPKNVQRLFDKKLSDLSIDKSIAKHKSVQVLSSQLAKKNYGKCGNIQQLDYDELLYSLHQINQSSNLFNSLTKESFVEPTCQVRNTKDPLKIMTESLPCLKCYSIYQRNMRGEKSLLSGNQEDRKESLDLIRPLTAGMVAKGFPTRGLSAEEFNEKFLDKIIERSEKLYCPSLY
tara:strand:+ start:222 stop:1019 length:798 start_codon:yes stop_codon:yes gene_type:complete